MTAFRVLSLSSHGAIELLLGLLLIVAPFALGFELAAGVIAVTAGALLVGLALSADQSLPVSAHHAFDHALAAALLAAAVIVGFGGDRGAGGAFAVAATAQLMLVASTRYVRPRR